LIAAGANSSALSENKSLPVRKIGEFRVPVARLTLPAVGGPGQLFVLQIRRPTPLQVS
jgi:hypothetical protein